MNEFFLIASQTKSKQGGRLTNQQLERILATTTIESTPVDGSTFVMLAKEGAKATVMVADKKGGLLTQEQFDHGEDWEQAVHIGRESDGIEGCIVTKSCYLVLQASDSKSEVRSLPDHGVIYKVKHLVQGQYADYWGSYSRSDRRVGNVVYFRDKESRIVKFILDKDMIID